MSDFIPLELQAEIMKFLPVKSLMQFRSVSKSYKSLIDSTEFIKLFHVITCKHPNRHLLVSYTDLKNLGDNYVSIVDDDTFPKNRSELLHPDIFTHPVLLLGSSQGLFCFYVTPGYDFVTTSYSAVIWNPSIQKHVAIDVPNVLGSPYETFIGFGVCPLTLDPKVVKISYIDQSGDLDTVGCNAWKVDVFTLSSGVWKSPFFYQARKSIALTGNPVVIDKIIYWLANDRIPDNGKFIMRMLILSFDLTTEIFTEIELPNSHLNPDLDYSISKVKECLVVVEPDRFAICVSDESLSVWVMNHDVPNSFVKKFNILAPVGPVLGFSKSFEPILSVLHTADDEDEYEYDDEDEDEYSDAGGLDYDSIAVYNPKLGRYKHVGLAAEYGSFFVNPYVETLLLLDQ